MREAKKWQNEEYWLPAPVALLATTWSIILKDEGYWVRGVDIKYPEYAPTQADEFEILDLRRWDNCLTGRARR